MIVDDNAHTYFTQIFLLLEVGDGESVDDNCGFSLFANCKDPQLPAAAKWEKPNFLSLAMGFSWKQKVPNAARLVEEEEDDETLNCNSNTLETLQSFCNTWTVENFAKLSLSNFCKLNCRPFTTLDRNFCKLLRKLLKTLFKEKLWVQQLYRRNFCKLSWSNSSYCNNYWKLSQF